MKSVYFSIFGLIDSLSASGFTRSLLRAVAWGNQNENQI